MINYHFLYKLYIQWKRKRERDDITYRYTGMGNPITLQIIWTFFLLEEVINFPPSYFSPGAFGGKFPVGSVNVSHLNITILNVKYSSTVLENREIWTI